MKKAIFLDFDGVLNTEKYQAQLTFENKSRYDEYGQLFDPDAVDNLKMILDAVPDALLVINSSWKIEGFDRIKDMWNKRGLPGKIHSVTPDYAPTDILDIDLENFDNIAMLAGKGNEVKRWIELYAPGGCEYVILDDMSDFLPEQNHHLICTNPKVGITMEDAVNAIKILTTHADR